MMLAPVVRGRKGEYKKDLEKLARAGLRARAHRRRAALARRGDPARQAQEPHHRSGGRPAAGQAGHREAPGSVHRDRHQAGQRPGAGRGGQRRGAALFAETGLPGLRHQRSATRAALVLLQQPVRRLRGMPRAGQQVDVRSRPRSSSIRRKPLFDGGLGPGAQLRATCSSSSRQPPRKHQDRPVQAVRGACRKKAQRALLYGGGGFPGILKAAGRDLRRTPARAIASGCTEYMSPAECPACHGKRLRPASLAVRVKGFSIADFTGHADGARAADGAQLGVQRAREADRRPHRGRDPQPPGISLAPWAWIT